MELLCEFQEHRITNNDHRDVSVCLEIIMLTVMRTFMFILDQVVFFSLAERSSSEVFYFWDASKP